MQTLKAQRLQNQQIEYPQYDNPVDILSYLGAIQGQDYAGAKWSLGLRLADCTDTQIEEAIADKQIVRTWLMRGTLFMTTASHVRWLLDIMASRVIAQLQRRYKELELDPDTLTRSNDILAKALDGGLPMGRRHLYAILEEHGISTKGQRGVHIVSHASLHGLIVQGTMNKNDPVFMCLDDACPATPTIPRDVALAELARCYFQSHGLATLQDFAWWTGLLMADVRAGFESIRSELHEEVIDGESYYYIRSSSAKPAPESPCVYVPPGFDEYLLGYKDRDCVLDPNYALQVYPGKNGVFFPTIVIDGQIRGIWKRHFKKGGIEVVATPFVPLSEAEAKAFVGAIERFGHYLEMPIHQISIG